MRTTPHQIYPVAALLLLAGATLWLERVTTTDEPRPATSQRLDPDFTAERTRLVSYGKDGRQHYELLADQVTHFPQTGIMQLAQPRLHYAADGREIRLSAETGEAHDAGNQVQLAGSVRAERDASANGPALSLESATLTIWPQDERAESTTPVKLTQGASLAFANGMKADNLFGNLELIGNVRMAIPRTARKSP